MPLLITNFWVMVEFVFNIIWPCDILITDVEFLCNINSVQFIGIFKIVKNS